MFFFFSITQKKSLKSRRLDIWFMSWMDGGDTIPHSEVKWYTNSYWQQDLQSLLMCIYIHIVHIVYIYICNIIMCHINILFYMTTILGHLTNTHMYMYIQTHKQHSVYMCIYIYLFLLYFTCWMFFEDTMYNVEIKHPDCTSCDVCIYV